MSDFETGLMGSLHQALKFQHVHFTFLICLFIISCFSMRANSFLRYSKSYNSFQGYRSHVKSSLQLSMVTPSEDKSLKKSLVICGPSGVGKGTIINHTLHKYAGKFGLSVSHTSRAARVGEEDGVHYHFVDKAFMEEKIKSSEPFFLEYAQVHGNFYGTSFAAIEAVQQANRICVLDVDVKGVKSVKLAQLPANYLFISPPSADVLLERLLKRGTENLDQIKVRTSNAKAEIEYGSAFGNFDAVVINDDLDTTLSEVYKLLHQWYPSLREVSPHK